MRNPTPPGIAPRNPTWLSAWLRNVGCLGLRIRDGIEPWGPGVLGRQDWGAGVPERGLGSWCSRGTGLWSWCPRKSPGELVFLGYRIGELASPRETHVPFTNPSSARRPGASTRLLLPPHFRPGLCTSELVTPCSAPSRLGIGCVWRGFGNCVEGGAGFWDSAHLRPGWTQHGCLGFQFGGRDCKPG